MKFIKTGTTRIVFLFRNIVIKIPNHSYSHQNFLNGCHANWSERNLCKKFRGCYWANPEEDILDYVVPSLWCSWFGLIQIQARAEPISGKEFKELKKNPMYRKSGADYKKENFEKYNGKIVALDYP